MMKIPTSEENLYSTLPPGYRFHPTDDELITYYLHRKISNIPFPVDLVPQINLYGYEPWQLPALSKFTVTGKEWYFFNLVSGHKKGSSVRPNRSRTNVNRETPEGQWISGLKREILVDGKIVGWKRKFTFFARTNGDRKKTDWWMMEYRSSKGDDIYPKGASLVISKIYAKITPAQLQIEPTLAHKVVVNEGNSSVQDIVLDTTQDRKSSLDGEQDLYSKKLEQVSTMAMPKAGQSILNDETSSSKTFTPSGCLSLPGFWFYPTDNELIEYYLKRKVLNLPIHDDAISEVDLFKWAPWDLPSQSRLQHKNMQWFFFNLHDRTHSHSYYNVNNQGVEGYWSSGTDLPVHNTSTNAIIGMKKFFVFHRGKFPNGKKTYWVMHEYRLREDGQIGPICVVIKIWNVSIQFKLTASEMHEKEVLAPVDKSTCALVSNLEAAKGDNVLHSPNNSEQGSSTPFMVGSVAEVAYTHENVPIAWYTATVTEIISEKVLLVEYLSLKNEDGSLLRETVSIQNIRPCPPSTQQVRDFQLLDIVEAFYNGGWWQGVIAAVKDQSKYNVKLMLLEDEIISSNTELRVVYDWINEEWILASQDEPLESQNNVESLHACSPLNKRKDPDPVATSMSDVDISGLLPSFKKNKNDQESGRPILRSKKGRESETAEDSIKFSTSRCVETSNVLKLGLEVPTLIHEEKRSNIDPNTAVEKMSEDSQQIGEVPETDQDAVQDESTEQQNNVESWHGCNHAPKCKDPNPVATSMNSIDVPCLLLPSIPQNNNNEESTRPYTKTTRIVSVGWHFMSFTRPMRINPWNHETLLNYCLLACCSMQKHKDVDPNAALTKVDQYSLFLTIIFTKWKQS